MNETAPRPALLVGIGFLMGLLLAAVVMLSTLMHYVSQDMEGFRRWLDRREP